MSVTNCEVKSLNSLFWRSNAGLQEGFAFTVSSIHEDQYSMTATCCVKSLTKPKEDIVLQLKHGEWTATFEVL